MSYTLGLIHSGRGQEEDWLLWAEIWGSRSLGLIYRLQHLSAIPCGQ